MSRLVSKNLLTPAGYFSLARNCPAPTRSRVFHARLIHKSPLVATPMELKIANPVAILNAIASNYESSTRILMEYVDNALDSGEEILRVESQQHDVESSNNMSDRLWKDRQSYPYKLRVFVEIDRQRKRVWVRDNCLGFPEEVFPNLVSGIGQSIKKGVPWLNGQFGFGFQAFRAAAKYLDCFSTENNLDGVRYLRIDREKSLDIAPPQTLKLDTVLEDNILVKEAIHSGLFSQTQGSLFTSTATDVGSLHGTSICLSEFDPVWFETVTGKALADEIERHFESLLWRNNLEVVVSEIDKSGKHNVIHCKPFDYEKLPGNRVVKEIVVNKSKDSVRCNIVVSNTLVRGKKVRFFKNGRCINHVSDVKSFMSGSTHKAKLWEHPSVCGFIEVGNTLEPVITRDEFTKNEARSKVYKKLYAIEEELMNSLNDSLSEQSDESMSALEALLQSSLNSLTRRDKKKNSNDPSAGESQDEVQVESTEQPLEYEKVVYTPIRSSKPKKRHASGPGIRFVHSKQVTSEAVTETQRSFCVDKTIYFNIDHPNFAERIEVDKNGRPKFTPRLAAYLSNELACHYRSEYYKKFDLQVPTDREQIYHDLFDSAYDMENLVAKRMSTLQRKLNKKHDAGSLSHDSSD